MPSPPSPVLSTGEFNLADYFLDRHLREGRGGRVAIAGVGPAVNYAELAGQTNRVGNLWRALRLAPGDRVLLVVPDCPAFLACFLGTVKVGAVAVPVNPFTRASDYAYYAADSGARLVVAHASSVAEVGAALAEVNPRPLLLTLEAESSVGESLEALLSREREECTPHPTRAEDLAFLLYTSGSGGQPRGAMHRHGDMGVTAVSFGQGVLGIGPDDITFSASKLFFAYGLGNSLTFPLSVGAATVLYPEKPSPEKLWEVIRQYQPTLFFSVPTLYGGLLREAERTQVCFDSVREAISAGESLPVELFERFRQRFGKTILDGIGTTEMLHMFISSRPGQARPGSCGTPVPGYEARIVDEEGAEVADGQMGNLWVRGESAFVGYWEKLELTARAKRPDGWVVTGDRFVRSSDGFYSYCGRADDMLKVAGMWVSPLEVENALLAHPAVAEAAVVGERGMDGLTQVVAHVVLREEAGERSTAAAPESKRGEELRRFVLERLPGYKCPARIEFAFELPRTATGKIQRYKLRQPR